MAAIKLIRENKEVTIKNGKERDEILFSLLADMVNGLTRIEKQLEKLTDEPLGCNEEEGIE